MTELDESGRAAKRAEARILDQVNRPGRSAFAWIKAHRSEIVAVLAGVAAIYILAHLV